MWMYDIVLGHEITVFNTTPSEVNLASYSARKSISACD